MKMLDIKVFKNTNMYKCTILCGEFGSGKNKYVEDLANINKYKLLTVRCSMLSSLSEIQFGDCVNEPTIILFDEFEKSNIHKEILLLIVNRSYNKLNFIENNVSIVSIPDNIIFMISTTDTFDIDESFLHRSLMLNF